MMKNEMPSPDVIAKFTRSVLPPLPEKMKKKWKLRNAEAGLTARGGKRKNKTT